jgi:hypothetical protein
MADHKPESVSPSSLIKVGGTNFFSMTDASGIDTMRASAPGFHSAIDRALKASGKVRGADPVVELAKREMFTQPKRQVQGFVKGAPVKDQKGRRLTIIHASVGYTKKTQTPVHEVVDKDGDRWLEKESNLKLRM